jgi:hypothetical protein
VSTTFTRVVDGTSDSHQSSDATRAYEIESDRAEHAWVASGLEAEWTGPRIGQNVAIDIGRAGSVELNGRTSAALTLDRLIRSGI